MVRSVLFVWSGRTASEDLCKKIFETVPQSLRISLVFSLNVGIMIAFGLLKVEITVIDCSSATITG